MEKFNKSGYAWCIRLLRGLSLLFILILGLISFPAAGQFTDNFSDGDFTNDPTWTTDSPSNWVIDNGRLRSNSSVASSTFYIATPSTKVTNAQWEFFVNLQFNTSSANYVDVFLVSANENLMAASNNGYFIRIGGTPDEVSLYKIVNGTTSILINGTDGVTNFSNNTLRIKVIRDASDLWTLSYDNTGTGANYFSEPPVTDNTFSSGNYFGIRITQSTSSFFNKHFFDDFYVGDIILDTEPPSILSATALSVNTVDVLFNEKVDPTSAQTNTNYSINNSIGQPQMAVLQPDGRTVRLTTSQNFQNGVTNRLTVSGVTDLAGNVANGITADFFFFQPQPVAPKDIILTEIFADPIPVIGLPDAEFVELHNRSSNPVSLAGWKFSDGSSTATLPSFILMPNAYVIVTASGSASLFTSFGSVLGVSNFPTLNNSGDNLTLRDGANQLIDAVNYTDAWYNDDDKKQGGWSLELIDPKNICAEEENWVASVHPSGGTPGKINSVNADKPDLTGPRLLSAILIAPTELKLIFDEKLNDNLPSETEFVIKPSIPPVSVSSVAFADASKRTLLLTLSNAPQPNTSYIVSVYTIRDCSGNLIQPNAVTVAFGAPEPAVVGDVVINELLFNPKPFGVDFIELKNTSSKYINLKNWSIGNFENNQATNLKVITTDDLLLAPFSILAFTTDPATIKSHYPNAHMPKLIKVKALPAFPDNEGSSSITDAAGVVLDQFTYSKNYHLVFIRDKEGVSLERIHPDRPSNDPNNWRSASSTTGFATPGYPNSNSLSEQPLQGEIVIDPEIFIPLLGQPDFTEIRYNFDMGGRVANVKIVDHQGREVKRLVNNEILATSGFFRWDGDRDDGTKASPGYYLVWFEVFDGTGRIDTFRKRVVIATRY